VRIVLVLDTGYQRRQKERSSRTS